jgi:hypothetical protein
VRVLFGGLLTGHQHEEGVLAEQIDFAVVEALGERGDDLVDVVDVVIHGVSPGVRALRPVQGLGCWACAAQRASTWGGRFGARSNRTGKAGNVATQIA